MTTELANPNKQCCTIPPVIVEPGEYQEKGSYKPYGGYEKAYFTGPENTGKAIIVAYDAFGYSSQGNQGADILAEQANVLVIIPDLFKGEQLSHSDFNGSPESQAKIQAWFASSGNPLGHTDGIYALGDTLRADGYKKVGFLGYCWGGKVVTLIGTDTTKVSAVAAVHPGRVDVKDAEPLAVPFAFFPSQGEKKEDCDAFWEALKSKPFFNKCTYKYYGDQIHGWAAARADLKDENVVAAFKDVYERLGTFFSDTLSE